MYTGDAWVWYVVVFGVVAALTMTIVGLASGDRVGPWWMYVVALAGFIALGAWAFRRGALKIALVEQEGALRVTVSGNAVSLDVELEPGHQRWCWVEHNAPTRGGPMGHFNLTVTAVDGRVIGFQQMGAPDGRDGWPRRDSGLADGADVFSCGNIFGLERALAARRASKDAGGALS